CANPRVFLCFRRGGPVTNVVEAIGVAIGPARVIDGEAIDSRYLSDWVVPMAGGQPRALAWPETTDQVSAIVRICHEAGVPLVPQGGRTGLAGGATPLDGSVVVSLERMTGIEEVDAAAGT